MPCLRKVANTTATNPNMAIAHTISPRHKLHLYSTICGTEIRLTVSEIRRAISFKDENRAYLVGELGSVVG